MITIDYGVIVCLALDTYVECAKSTNDILSQRNMDGWWEMENIFNENKARVRSKIKAKSKYRLLL